MKRFLKVMLIIQIAFCLITVSSFGGLAANGESGGTAPESPGSSNTLDSSNGTSGEGSTESIPQKNGFYDTLLSCGYPAEFLEAIPDATKVNILTSIKDKEISNVRYRTDYQLGTTAEDSKVVIRTAVAEIKDPETEGIAGESVCVFWEWVDGGPLLRSEDYVAAIWDNSVFVFEEDSFRSQDLYRAKADDGWSVHKSRRTLANAEQGGIGHYTELKAFKKYVGGSMVFELVPASPIEKGETFNDRLMVKYDHDVAVKSLKTTAVLIAVPVAIIAVIVIIVVRVTAKKRKKLQ